MVLVHSLRNALLRYGHFARRYTTKWCNLLRFSCPTGFPECDDCVAYKTAFEESTETLL